MTALSTVHELVVSPVASRVASPVAINSSSRALIRHRSADRRLSTLPTSLQYIEVVS